MDSTAGDPEPLVAGQKYLVRSTTDVFIGTFTGITIDHDLNKLGGVYLEFEVNGKATSVWSLALKSIKLTYLDPIGLYEPKPSWEEPLASPVKYNHLYLLKEVPRLKKHLRYSGIIGCILAGALTWAILYIIRN